MKSKQYILSILLILYLIHAPSSQAQTGMSISVDFSTKRTNVYLRESVRVLLRIRSSGVNLGQNIQLRGMPSGDRLTQFGEVREGKVTRAKIDNRIIETDNRERPHNA